MEQGYNRKEYCGFKQYQNYYERGIGMIVVGINVAKHKCDCFITNSEGEVLLNAFIIQNNRDGFDSLSYLVANPPGLYAPAFISPTPPTCGNLAFIFVGTSCICLVSFSSCHVSLFDSR